jgi:rRNA maturation protein Nop10
MSVEKCPTCGSYSSQFPNPPKNSLKTDKHQIMEKVEVILNSSKDAYEKKIDLFNFLKDLEVEGLEDSEEKRINCLLLGKFYNEISKQKMKEYKKLTAEEFSKEE